MPLTVKSIARAGKLVVTAKHAAWVSWPEGKVWPKKQTISLHVKGAVVVTVEGRTDGKARVEILRVKKREVIALDASVVERGRFLVTNVVGVRKGETIRVRVRNFSATNPVMMDRLQVRILTCS